MALALENKAMRLVNEFLEREGYSSFNRLYEYVENKMEIEKQVFQHAINQGFASGLLMLDGDGDIVVKKEVQEELIREREQYQKQMEELAKKPIYEGELIQNDGENHPMLNRPLTKEETILLSINKRKIEDVTLERQYQIIAKQMAEGDILTSMLIGEPGTGKTTIARKIGEELKLPVYAQNYALNSEEMHIIGGFIPDEENGGFKWVDGQFTKAFRSGGVYIAEEPNYAKPGVLGIMNNALDGVGELVLPSGEVVQRHAAFRFFGCMNVGLAGTQRMNLAFINRMNKVLKFEPMTHDRQIEIIKRSSSYENERIIRAMVEASDAIRQKIKHEQIDGATISIRNLINWAKDVRLTQDILSSSWSTVIWAVCMEDDEIQQEIYEDIIASRFEGVTA